MTTETCITPETVIHRNNENVSAEVDGETVLMSISNGSYYGMNAVGSRIWALLEAETTFGKLCAALLEEFDASPEQVEGEVKSFLEKMLAEKLIRLELE